MFGFHFHKWTIWSSPVVIESGIIDCLAQRRTCTTCNAIDYRKVSCDGKRVYSKERAFGMNDDT